MEINLLIRALGVVMGTEQYRETPTTAGEVAGQGMCVGVGVVGMDRLVG